MARNFLLEINARGAFTLVVSKWASFRRHSDIQRIMLGLVLLPGGYHVRTHVQTDVLVASVGIR